MQDPDNFKAIIIAPDDLPANDLKSLEEIFKELCKELDTVDVKELSS